MITSMVSSAASSAAVSMTTSIGLPEYGVLAVVALIFLLSAKEILSASKYWNKSVSASLDMSIFPLFLVFAGIVVFKVVEIV
ncbi:hypothetical protein [Methanococcoides sp.]|uniref:hypothetical protein n=1 Tax=Methanococcoides sp. TaxID=1966350 RepID=UPI00272E5580|nr:hypothetical protein [Methanococcoides sp.]